MVRMPTRLYYSFRGFCSISTMYRILADEHGETNKRRAQQTHPTYMQPGLLATAQHQVRSWDIPWLRGPDTWQHFSLYITEFPDPSAPTIAAFTGL